MKPKRNLISAAVAVALAAAAASPAYAALERMGAVNNAPSVGGYPAWFQDKSGITLEFCDLSTQAEFDGGWCVLIAPDGPPNGLPEVFPTNYFDEHFYYAADNVIVDTGIPFKARLVVALEAAFAVGPPIPGDQMTFTRLRVFLPNLPFDGDYRVVTPFSDTTYFDQVVGDRIFETLDIGTACPTTFECTLNGTLGPFLLPSATAGGAEVPPMPDLASAPAGTDPFYDQLIAAGPATADPGTGKKYLADPARTGAITGSPLPPFTAYDIDRTGATTGIPSQQNHNTFRIEVRNPSPNHDGPVFFVADGTNQFTINGRLMTGAIPGNVSSPRATYKADASGAVTDLDVYAKASATVQARIPTQPVPQAVVPQIGFYDQACGGALTTDPTTGLIKVNAGPYTAPASASHTMASTGNDYWGQSSPGGAPASHVCIEDTSSRNAAGQVVPTYSLVPLTDQVTITTSHFVGPQNGTLTVNAVSSDPTAVLTLAGYGPSDPATPGVAIGKGAGTGVELAGGAAQVLAIAAPPSKVQVVSTKGGSQLRETDTAHGAAILTGIPSAVNDTLAVSEDCSAIPALSCAAGAGVTVDLLANDTVMLNGVILSLRQAVTQNLAAVTVSADPARLGTATVTADGILTYTPNANANGTDNVNYRVTVDGNVSNQAVVTVNIAAVNDLPVAGNVTIGAVAGKANTLNLLAAATDPDGAADLRNAIITGTWPAQLGPQPTPVNGVITFTPTATGNFPISFQVTDAAGSVSANTATATPTVIAAETIAYTSSQYTISKGRWVVSGTDTVRANQTLTIAYANGVLRTGEVCTGSDAIPACVVGTAKVDGAGTWLLDFVGASGVKDPQSTSWANRPTTLRTYSSNPNLGGTRDAGITLK